MIEGLRFPPFGSHMKEISSIQHKTCVVSRKSVLLRCRENTENVSTAPSDRGRSISPLWAPYERDKVPFIIKHMALEEKRFFAKMLKNIEKVSNTPSDRGRSISRVPYEGDKVQFLIKDMVLVE